MYSPCHLRQSHILPTLCNRWHDTFSDLFGNRLMLGSGIYPRRFSAAIQTFQIQPPVFIGLADGIMVPAEQPVKKLNHFFLLSSRAHSRRRSFTSLRFCVRRVFTRPPHMHTEQHRAGIRSPVRAWVFALVRVPDGTIPNHNLNNLFS